MVWLLRLQEMQTRQTSKPLGRPATECPVNQLEHSARIKKGGDPNHRRFGPANDHSHVFKNMAELASRRLTDLESDEVLFLSYLLGNAFINEKCKKASHTEAPTEKVYVHPLSRGEVTAAMGKSKDVAARLISMLFEQQYLTNAGDVWVINLYYIESVLFEHCTPHARGKTPQQKYREAKKGETA